MSREVSAFLRRRLGEEVQLRESRRGTGNLAAWQRAQEAERLERGVQAFLDAGDVDAAAQEFSRADTLFAEAAALDDKWASPEIARGWIDYRRARELARGFDKAHYAEWIEKGLVHADRALALAPNDPDALELRGTFRYLNYLLNLVPDAEQELSLAEQDLVASVRANPQQASALTTLSHLLMNQGKTAQAKVQAQRAYEADPYLSNVDRTIWRLFTSSLDLAEAVEATRWCEEGAPPLSRGCSVRRVPDPGAGPPGSVARCPQALAIGR